VLVLRDVLAFRAREVADMLGTSEVAVNRALQRARTAIERTTPPARHEAAPLPGSREERELVARFTVCFEAGDIPGILALLTQDAVLTMPPEPLEYEGPHAIGEFLSTVPAGGALDRFRLVPTRANGQPAFGCYLRDPHTPIGHAYGLMVLTLSGDRIAAITGFPDTSVFRSFGLPRTLPD
jgi:RNA polymerase sigma-70 factor (ECF subfamily)